MARSRLLRAYLLAEFRTPTLLAIALWSSLLLMNEFFIVARMAIQMSLSVETVARLVVLTIPRTLILAIPMGTLLGSLLAVGRLSADHELIAIESAGLGPGFLLRPALVHGALATLAALAVYGLIQPWASYEIRAMQAGFVTGANLTTEIRPRVFFDRLPGKVLFVNEILPGTSGELQGVLFYDGRVGGGREQIILAKDATIEPTVSPEGGLQLDLRHGVLHDFRGTEPESYRASAFDRYVPEPLTLPAYLLGSDRPPERTSPADMTPWELREEVREARTEPDPVIRPFRVRLALIEFHKRFALPLACLLFAVLALPLGSTRVRSGKGAGFALSMAVILVYYLVFTTAQTQATQGRLPPSLAIWTADVAIAIWAAIALTRMRRRRERKAPLRQAMRRLGKVLRRRRPEARGPIVRALEGASSEEAPMASRPARRVGLIDAYVARTYVRMTVLALGFAVLIFALIEIRNVLEVILQRQQPVASLIRYVIYFLPGTLSLAVPFACLIGAVVTFTLLGRRGELTAMKASGISMRRATGPVIAVTAAVCALSFLVQNHVAPETNQRAQQIKDRLEGRSPRTYGVAPDGRWTFGSGGLLYHYRLYDPVLERFQGLSVFVVDFATPRVAAHRFAATAQWDGSAWTMAKGWVRTFPAAGAAREFRSFDEETVEALDPPENFSRSEATLARGSDLPDVMGLRELGEQIATLSSAGYDTTRLRVAWHAKLARPVTPLVMVLLGLPFAFRVGRRGTLYGVGVALILAIVYWAAAAVANALGLETILPPVLAAWAPNIFFAGIGGYLMLYIRT